MKKFSRKVHGEKQQIDIRKAFAKAKANQILPSSSSENMIDHQSSPSSIN